MSERRMRTAPARPTSVRSTSARSTRRSLRSAWLAFGIVSSAACLGYEPGLEVAIELRVAPPTARVPMREGFATVTTARLRIGAVELLRCEARDGRSAELSERSLASRAVDVLRDAWRSRARAHVSAEDGPATLVDARHTSGTIVGPSLRPPPGRYCALRVHVEPDADTPSFALVGASETPFATIVESSFDVDVPFVALTLDAPGEPHVIALDVDPACWLADGVPSHEEVAERLGACL